MNSNEKYTKRKKRRKKEKKVRKRKELKEKTDVTKLCISNLFKEPAWIFFCQIETCKCFFGGGKEKGLKVRQ